MNSEDIINILESYGTISTYRWTANGMLSIRISNKHGTYIIENGHNSYSLLKMIHDKLAIKIRHMAICIESERLA